MLPKAYIHLTVKRLRQVLLKTRRREIRVYTFPIALNLERHIGSSAAVIPVQFQSDTIIISSNLAATRLHDIWG